MKLSTRKSADCLARSATINATTTVIVNVTMCESSSNESSESNGVHEICGDLESRLNSLGNQEAVVPAGSRPASASELAQSAADLMMEDATVTQSLVRSSADGMDCILATCRITFAATQKKQVLHVPVYPAMIVDPQVHVEFQACDMTAKVTAANRFGVRIELVSGTAHAEAMDVIVDVSIAASTTV